MWQYILVYIVISQVKYSCGTYVAIYIGLHSYITGKIMHDLCMAETCSCSTMHKFKLLATCYWCCSMEPKKIINDVSRIS